MLMSSISHPVQLICCSLLFASILPANSGDNKSRGIAEYEAKNYDTAITYLNAALSSSPNDAVVHYYLANSYSHTKQLDRAAKEYMASQTLSQNKTLSLYCQSALDSIEKRQTKTKKPSVLSEAESTFNNRSESTDHSKAASQSQIPLTTARQASIQADPVHSAIERITSQADLEGKTAQTAGEGSAKRKATSQDLLIDNLRAEEAARLDYMQNAVAYDSFGKPYHIFTENEIRLARENYELKISDAKTASAGEVQSVLDQGMQKNMALKQMAKSLVSQLDKTFTPGSGTVRLLPTGTNIYVRNYLSTGRATTNTPTAELLATQEKMILIPKNHDGRWHYGILPDGLTAQQQVFAIKSQDTNNKGKSEKFTSAEVRGQLLPKK